MDSTIFQNIFPLEGASMEIQSINLTQKLFTFNEQWSPRIIAQMNDYHFKLAKIQGEFIWHQHPETDEVFYVVMGEMRIEFREQAVRLSEGELCVVPRGVEHKPVAKEECHILLIEPAGTLNTGDVTDEHTQAEELWI
jgi:mannose-6-phosphate isomerase-like protein (cupin superfamily)